MTLHDLIQSLNRAESVEFVCHENDANQLLIRSFKKTRTGHVIFKEVKVFRSQLIRDLHADKRLEGDVRKSLKALREHAGRKTGEEGVV